MYVEFHTITYIIVLVAVINIIRALFSYRRFTDNSDDMKDFFYGYLPFIFIFLLLDILF